MLRVLQRHGMLDAKFHPVIETHSKNIAGKAVDLDNSGQTAVDFFGVGGSVACPAVTCCQMLPHELFCASHNVCKIGMCLDGSHALIYLQ